MKIPRVRVTNRKVGAGKPPVAVRRMSVYKNQCDIWMGCRLPVGPEDKAREEIDRQLVACGWVIQDNDQLNLGAGVGVALRNFSLPTGPCDYLLFIDRKVAGVVEAKPEGVTLTGVSEQSERHRSSSASLISCGTGHLMPSTFPRLTYSPTAVLPTPVAALIWRTLSSSACVSRCTSLIFLIDTLIVGVAASAASAVLVDRGGHGLIRMSTGATPACSEQTSETVRDHRNAVRDASERVSAMRRNLQTARRSCCSLRRRHRGEL